MHASKFSKRWLSVKDSKKPNEGMTVMKTTATTTTLPLKEMMTMRTTRSRATAVTTATSTVTMVIKKYIKKKLKIHINIDPVILQDLISQVNKKDRQPQVQKQPQQPQQKHGAAVKKPAGKPSFYELQDGVTAKAVLQAAGKSTAAAAAAGGSRNLPFGQRVLSTSTTSVAKERGHLGPVEYRFNLPSAVAGKKRGGPPASSSAKTGGRASGSAHEHRPKRKMTFK